MWRLTVLNVCSGTNEAAEMLMKSDQIEKYFYANFINQAEIDSGKNLPASLF